MFNTCEGSCGSTTEISGNRILVFVGNCFWVPYLLFKKPIVIFLGSEKLIMGTNF